MTLAVGTGRETVVETSRMLATEGFRPPERLEFASEPAWAALRALGTELWLDTGDVEAAGRLWSAEFSHLTTNNTLVNREVQKGLYDQVIARSGRALREADSTLSPDELVLEVGFVVNCRTALHLVEAFDARVSVELHPAMSGDVPASLRYAHRYYAVCPERFIIKVPLSPAGYLIARQLSTAGIPVNFTLGFSARQNALAAAFSRPAYVNVFMGRLNSFVADNGLGDGANVGEKTTAATQQLVREGRERGSWPSRLIGASMRSASQACDLAGLDVFTLPTAVAEEYRTLFRAGAAPPVAQPLTPERFPVHAEYAEVLDRLWHTDERVFAAAEALARQDTTAWTGEQLAAHLREAGVTDLFYDWSPAELEQLRADGKIPRWERWKDALTSGRLALDELMTVSALYSFVHDQQALDARIRRLLEEAGVF